MDDWSFRLNEDVLVFTIVPNGLKGTSSSITKDELKWPAIVVAYSNNMPVKCQLIIRWVALVLCLFFIWHKIFWSHNCRLCLNFKERIVICEQYRIGIKICWLVYLVQLRCAATSKDFRNFVPNFTKKAISLSLRLNDSLLIDCWLHFKLNRWIYLWKHLNCSGLD